MRDGNGREVTRGHDPCEHGWRVVRLHAWPLWLDVDQNDSVTVNHVWWVRSPLATHLPG